MICKEKIGQVKTVLLMPIEAITGKNQLFKHQNKIYSSQSYYSGPDQDMTDFAVEYYEIIYQNIIPNQHILRKPSDYLNAKFENNSFAGDTINSFNWIANLTPEAGKNSTQRTAYNNWPKYLQNYFQEYHCLANFWLLPSKIGRGGKVKSKIELMCPKSKNSCHDYMDSYLEYIFENWAELSMKSTENEYFSQFTDWVDFVRQHFLYKIYTDENYHVVMYSKSKDPKFMVEHIMKMIALRADAIANSKFNEELYNYFVECGLIGKNSKGTI
ncbi:hypothetical protein OZX56_06485 [Lactobacillus sp. ESL0684]|uniref:hypothetical protein n=1 Tax=Lactobacillus sp. ESL0684 TaxID=2983213 RepID=UPI0023F91D76|nr:hypothetical protein [Lactobacillus sp. ESL0684]WEV43187.1 hypothetical protein OZX56_06485 [Lactobacillus sp. ESL0684]